MLQSTDDSIASAQRRRPQVVAGAEAEGYLHFAAGPAGRAAGTHLQRAAQVDARQGPHHLPVRLLLQLRRRRPGPPQGWACLCCIVLHGLTSISQSHLRRLPCRAASKPHEPGRTKGGRDSLCCIGWCTLHNHTQGTCPLGCCTEAETEFQQGFGHTKPVLRLLTFCAV